MSSASSNSNQTITRRSLSSKHDVFLSFYGNDVREGFLTNLYNALKDKGIRPFKDDEAIKKGGDIPEELLKGIEDSLFAVVIFSKNYASSRWCLNELEKIVECKQNNGSRVLPIFYDVKAAVVRYQTEEYATAFAKHEGRYNTDKLAEWRKALTIAADCSGWSWRNFRDNEVKLFEEITETILDSLDLIRMDYSRTEDIRKYLDIKWGDFYTIGITGKKGIGKSTIAQEIFKTVSKEFDASCFLSNIKDECSKVNGLLYLKKVLFQQLLGMSVDPNLLISDGEVNVLRNKLGSKKVLIILDDVDDSSHIKGLVRKYGQRRASPFGRGSRIIIISSIESVLKSYGVNEICMVEELRFPQALGIFLRKSLRERNISDYDKLKKLATDIVLSHNALRLPLVVNVLGSYLYLRKKNEWEETVERLRMLKRDNPRDIYGPLEISISGLKKTQKQIFLDIACFFKGEDQYRVRKILRGRSRRNKAINSLIEKSLITIEGDKFWMHDLLQEMGHRYVCRSEAEPGKRCRLWLYNDVRHLFINNTGTKSVEGIWFEKKERDLDDDASIRTDATFSKMCNLRLLKIRNIDTSGDPIGLSNNLRLFEWHKFPSECMPHNFKPNNLVELSLPNSRIQQLWSEKVFMDKLRVLDLSNCRFLTRTPDFGIMEVPKLELLIFENCQSLVEVHSSIEKLEHLILLNLKGCKCLKKLPNSISLKNLRTFILSGCSELKKLPDMDDMGSLSKLYLDGTAIEELQTGLGKSLSSLVLLNLRDCKNLLTLPSFICSLRSLKELILAGSSRISKLPEDIGNLEQLEVLDVSRTTIRTLPSSFKNLKSLKQLFFQGCRRSLWLSVFCNCFLLDECLEFVCLNFPDWFSKMFQVIGDLGALQYLDLSEGSFMCIPTSIIQFSKLVVLNLSKCTNLRRLPKCLPPCLRYIYARDCPMLTACRSDFTVWTSDRRFVFIDCFKSGDTSMPEHPALAMHVDELFPEFIKDQIDQKMQFEIHFPFNGIPDWCSQSSSESSITFQHPSDGTLIGIVLFIVYELHGVDKNKYVVLEQAQCSFDTRDGRLNNTITFDIFYDHSCQSYGALIYIPRGKIAGQLIKASFSTNRSNVKVKECGFRNLLSDEDSAKFARDLVQSAKRSRPIKKQTHNSSEVHFDENASSTINQGRTTDLAIVPQRRCEPSVIPKPFQGLKEGRFQVHHPTSPKNRDCLGVRSTQLESFGWKRRPKYKEKLYSIVRPKLPMVEIRLNSNLGAMHNPLNSILSLDDNGTITLSNSMPPLNITSSGTNTPDMESEAYSCYLDYGIDLQVLFHVPYNYDGIQIDNTSVSGSQHEKRN